MNDYNNLLIVRVLFRTLVSDLKRVNDLRKIERNRSKKSHFVLSSWVSESITDGYTKNERHFEPRTKIVKQLL